MKTNKCLLIAQIEFQTEVILRAKAKIKSIEKEIAEFISESEKDPMNCVGLGLNQERAEE